MRSVQVGAWLAVFVAGACASAYGQVIVPPNVSGRTIAADAGASYYQQSVYSTGTFDASLVVFRNTQAVFSASAVVCTSGPLTTVGINVPFNQFGLRAGDFVMFAFTVRHHGTEGSTCSTVLTAIPVVPGVTPTLLPPKTTTSPSVGLPLSSMTPCARREDEAAV